MSIRELRPLLESREPAIYGNTDVGQWLSAMPDVEPYLAKIAEIWRQHSGSCVYFLVYEGKIVYVGSTSDMRIRLKAHLKTKTFIRKFIVKCSHETRFLIETFFIVKLRPELNGRKSLPAKMTLAKFHELDAAFSAGGNWAREFERILRRS